MPTLPQFLINQIMFLFYLMTILNALNILKAILLFVYNTNTPNNREKISNDREC